MDSYTNLLKIGSGVTKINPEELIIPLIKAITTKTIHSRNK